MASISTMEDSELALGRDLPNQTFSPQVNSEDDSVDNVRQIFKESLDKESRDAVSMILSIINRNKDAESDDECMTMTQVVRQKKPLLSACLSFSATQKSTLDALLQSYLEHLTTCHESVTFSTTLASGILEAFSTALSHLSTVSLFSHAHTILSHVHRPLHPSLFEFLCQLLVAISLSSTFSLDSSFSTTEEKPSQDASLTSTTMDTQHALALLLVYHCHHTQCHPLNMVHLTTALADTDITFLVSMKYHPDQLSPELSSLFSCYLFQQCSQSEIPMCPSVGHALLDQLVLKQLKPFPMEEFPALVHSLLLLSRQTHRSAILFAIFDYFSVNNTQLMRNEDHHLNDSQRRAAFYSSLLIRFHFSLKQDQALLQSIFQWIKLLTKSTVYASSDVSPSTTEAVFPWSSFAMDLLFSVAEMERHRILIFQTIEKMLLREIKDKRMLHFIRHCALEGEDILCDSYNIADSLVASIPSRSALDFLFYLLDQCKDTFSINEHDQQQQSVCSAVSLWENTNSPQNHLNNTANDSHSWLKKTKETFLDMSDKSFQPSLYLVSLSLYTLVRLFLTHEEYRVPVLSKWVSLLGCPGYSTLFTDLVIRAVSMATNTVRMHTTLMDDLLDSCWTLSNHRLMEGLMPILNMSAPLLDQFILMLRKASFHKDVEMKKTAIHGWIRVMTLLETRGLAQDVSLIQEIVQGYFRKILTSSASSALKSTLYEAVMEAIDQQKQVKLLTASSSTVSLSVMISCFQELFVSHYQSLVHGGTLDIDTVCLAQKATLFNAKEESHGHSVLTFPSQWQSTTHVKQHDVMDVLLKHSPWVTEPFPLLLQLLLRLDQMPLVEAFLASWLQPSVESLPSNHMSMDASTIDCSLDSVAGERQVAKIMLILGIEQVLMHAVLIFYQTPSLLSTHATNAPALRGQQLRLLYQHYSQLSHQLYEKSLNIKGWHWLHHQPLPSKRLFLSTTAAHAWTLLLRESTASMRDDELRCAFFDSDVRRGAKRSLHQTLRQSSMALSFLRWAAYGCCTLLNTDQILDGSHALRAFFGELLEELLESEQRNSERERLLATSDDASTTHWLLLDDRRCRQGGHRASISILSCCLPHETRHRDAHWMTRLVACLAAPGGQSSDVILCLDRLAPPAVICWLSLASSLSSTTATAFLMQCVHAMPRCELHTLRQLLLDNDQTQALLGTPAHLTLQLVQREQPLLAALLFLIPWQHGQTRSLLRPLLAVSERMQRWVDQQQQLLLKIETEGMDRQHVAVWVDPSVAEHVIRTTMTLYHVTATLLKEIIKDRCVMVEATEEITRLLRLICPVLSVALASSVYAFLLLIQQLEGLGEEEERRGQMSAGMDKVGHKSRVKGKSKKRPQRWSLVIPSLIYAMEQYERYLLQYNKRFKTTLVTTMKRSTARDFRIQVAQLEAEWRQDEQPDAPREKTAKRKEVTG